MKNRNKGSFVMYEDNLALFQQVYADFGGEALLELLTGFFEHGLTKNHTPFKTKGLESIFTRPKQELEELYDSWQFEKEKRSIAGKKGMANRWGKSNTYSDESINKSFDEFWNTYSVLNFKQESDKELCKDIYQNLIEIGKSAIEIELQTQELCNNIEYNSLCEILNSL